MLWLFHTPPYPCCCKCKGSLKREENDGCCIGIYWIEMRGVSPKFKIHKSKNLENEKGRFVRDRRRKVFSIAATLECIRELNVLLMWKNVSCWSWIISHTTKRSTHHWWIKYTLKIMAFWETVRSWIEKKHTRTHWKGLYFYSFQNHTTTTPLLFYYRSFHNGYIIHSLVLGVEAASRRCWQCTFVDSPPTRLVSCRRRNRPNIYEYTNTTPYHSTQAKLKR